MARLSEEKIAEIRRVYKENGVYSKTAKICGCSPATVKKYCTIETTPVEKKEPIRFSSIVPKVSEMDLSIFTNSSSMLFELSPQEKVETERLFCEI